MRYIALTIPIIAAFLFLLSAAPATAHPAWGIVINHSGEVYFSDLEAVWRLDTKGVLSLARAGAAGHHVHELGIDAQGNIYGPDYEYVSESQGYRTGLWKMAPSGRVSYVVPPSPQLPQGLGVWRDSDGNTYAVEEDNHLRRETLLVRRSAAGRVVVLAGGRYGFADGVGARARFSNIVGMFLTGNEIYVTDGGAVRRVSRQGIVTTLAIGLDRPDSSSREQLSFGSLMGIAVSPTRSIYVADFRNRRILKLAENGIVSVVSRAEPPWSPTGVAVAKNGDVYILEVGFQSPSTWIKPRVRKVSPSGNTAIVARVH